MRFLYTSAIEASSLDMNLKLYVLGDRLQATDLCERIHASIKDLFHRFTEAQLEYVLDNTAPGDRLRRSCILQLGTAVRSSLFFPYSHQFAKVLCEEHASEILADIICKYDSIIMEPARADGTTATTLLNPELFTGFKLTPPSQSGGRSNPLPKVWTPTYSSASNGTHGIFNSAFTSPQMATQPPQPVLPWASSVLTTSSSPSSGIPATVQAINNASSFGPATETSFKNAFGFVVGAKQLPLPSMPANPGSGASVLASPAGCSSSGLFRVPADSTTVALSSSIFGPRPSQQSTTTTASDSTSSTVSGLLAPRNMSEEASTRTTSAAAAPDDSSAPQEGHLTNATSGLPGHASFPRPSTGTEIDVMPGTSTITSAETTAAISAAATNVSPLPTPSSRAEDVAPTMRNLNLTSASA